MPKTQPNILLVTTDQQRYDAAGGAGPSFLRTPHYDHLRREGITFTRAYSDCPLCVPARASILTGQYAVTHGLTGNQPTHPAIGRERTLPGVLRSLGYATAAIGKMHWGPQRVRHGFDEMILPQDYYRAMARSGNPLQPMRHGLGQNELFPGMATVPEAMTLTAWTAEQCVEYIRERRDPSVPFFLWCSFSKPHPPLDPPEPYYSMYRNSPIPKPFVGKWSEGKACPEAFRRAREQFSFDLLTPEAIREARAAYYGLITQCDYNMGRVFAALQDFDLFDDTLILYTSDHGEFLGDHHAGAKTFFHEGAAHVPFVLRLPKSSPSFRPGLKLDALVTHADILPTLVAAAGGRPPADCDGLDLVALAEKRGNPARPYLHATALPLERFDYLAVTDGRWKYLYYPEGAVEQLFDLAKDPGELADLSSRSSSAKKLAELRAEVIRFHMERRTGRVRDGKLLVRPLRGDTTAQRRSRSWPGYHTENYDKDVRH